MPPLLSVIVPVYNEAKTIRQILDKIQAVPIDKEIVIIDDGSIDGTGKILNEVSLSNVKVIHHISNRGKGDAVSTGINHSSGEFIIIQDADLEYEPNDYAVLIQTMKENPDAVVLGVRFRGRYKGLLLHRWGNRFLTALLNFLFGSHFNDYATCYKLASRKTFSELNLRARGFDIEVEIMCNALRQKKRFIEVPVHYNPRTYREGKKIRWLDGLWAMYYMFKFRFSKHDEKRG